MLVSRRIVRLSCDMVLGWTSVLRRRHRDRVIARRRVRIDGTRLGLRHVWLNGRVLLGRVRQHRSERSLICMVLGKHLLKCRVILVIKNDGMVALEERMNNVAVSLVRRSIVG